MPAMSLPIGVTDFPREIVPSRTTCPDRDTSFLAYSYNSLK